MSSLVSAGVRSVAGKITRSALERACRQTKRYGLRQDIIAQGDPTDGVSLVLEGWACRYKHLEDGRRQFLAYFVPGDFCDLRVFILRRMDHAIATLTPATVATLQPETVRDLTYDHLRITQMGYSACCCRLPIP